MKPAEIKALLRVARPPARYGRNLARVHNIEDLARIARRRLPDAALAYLDGGGEDEVTLRRNRAAFEELELVPRVLRDVSCIELATRVLDTDLAYPFALAPIGSLRLIHHEGELATARAAAACGIPMTLSSSGTCSIEAVAAAARGPRWYQLYVWRDRGLCKDLIARARESGYRALIVTVDTTLRSKRERELRVGLDLPQPALTVSSVLDGARHPRWAWHFLTSEAIRFANLTPRDAPPEVGMNKMARSFDGLTTWDDLDWIRDAWRGPLAVKGVLSVDDARRAAEEGIGAIVVSNHGGRQLDRVPAALEALPEIVDVVGDRVEVLMDGGIRRGSDVFMAMALGARACLLGRAHVYGLAAGGESGVRAAIDLLADELRTVMGLSGVARLDEIDRRLVRPRRTDSQPMRS